MSFEAAVQAEMRQRNNGTVCTKGKEPRLPPGIFQNLPRRKILILNKSSVISSEYSVYVENTVPRAIIAALVIA